MVLTDQDIRSYAQRENEPLIVPFREKQLQAGSYDVTLSSQLTAFKRGRQTLALDEKLPDDSSIYEFIEMDETGYELQPNEYVLVKLQEKLTIPEDCVAHLRPRTRFTRIGLLLADQHCNPTYSGVLSVGLFNASPYTLRLKEGISIGQVVFERMTGTPSEEKQYRNKANAAYMNESSFRGSVLGEAGWSEEMRAAYKDLLHKLDEKD